MLENSDRPERDLAALIGWVKPQARDLIAHQQLPALGDIDAIRVPFAIRLHGKRDL